MFLLPPVYYQVKKTKHKGRGVFARKEIPAGTIIGDYTGRLIKDEEIEAIEEKFGRACYSMDYNNNGLSIFPLDVKASGVHLINHSCSANCDTYFYYGHTLFFSLRRLLPGEEITIDYSFDPEDGGKQEGINPCFCGSPFCRGTMYTSDEKLRRYGAFCRQETKGQKFTLLTAGEFLSPLKKYPKRIKDNKIFNLFADLKIKSLSYDDKKLPSLTELRKRLRTTGRILNFISLGLKVVAVVDGKIVVEK
ncbi:MAG: SET domain-containing protein [Patescibacteria group bacterium]|jgi:hypothetical protein